jgi:hypothetical protein
VVTDIATATVHTTGLNWDSIAVLGVMFASMMIAGLSYVNLRQAQRSNSMHTSISTAVENLGKLLEAKLETKDNVAALRSEIIELKAYVKAREEVHHGNARG